jgi:hypothetical protein
MSVGEKKEGTRDVVSINILQYKVFVMRNQGQINEVDCIIESNAVKS